MKKLPAILLLITIAVSALGCLRYTPSREELEEFLTEALSIMTKLAHQVTELKEYVNKVEGKTD